MRKEDILDEQHWVYPDYRQRLTTRLWKELLLNDDDKIIFRGRVTGLVCKKLGYGVVEITKRKEKYGSNTRGRRKGIERY